jgi:hypothetical protein
MGDMIKPVPPKVRTMALGQAVDDSPVLSSHQRLARWVRGLRDDHDLENGLYAAELATGLGGMSASFLGLSQDIYARRIPQEITVGVSFTYTSSDPRALVEVRAVPVYGQAYGQAS